MQEINFRYRIRGFEVVKDEFRKFPNNEILYPLRGSKHSAGYDFYSNEDIIIEPKAHHVFWTDIKAYMLPTEVLKIHVRSSIAIKKKLTLRNQVGIIDSDYYSNIDNDGNIGVCLYNGSRAQIRIQKGERIAQGIFEIYLVADNDLSDASERKGGIGSTT